PLDQLQAPVTPRQTRVSLWDEALEDLKRLQKTVFVTVALMGGVLDDIRVFATKNAAESYFQACRQECIDKGRLVDDEDGYFTTSKYYELSWGEHPVQD
ncbi:MAG: hypothetical protein M0Z47_00145, partial [Actinomycetota bacterium]|nr:hypothetical protein [Actinomycetota bacterium]